MLRQIFGNVYGVLPERTAQHLTKALERWHAKDPDGQRVAMGQAVESLFAELVIAGLKDAGEDRVSVELQQRGNAARELSLDGKRTLQMSEWSQVLGTINRSKGISPFELALTKAFPGVNLQALSRLSKDLRQMSSLRGRASHDSQDYWEWKVDRASKLWSMVAGEEGSPGFLETGFALRLAW